MVGVFQGGAHLFEIVDGLLVAVALLEPAGAEQDAVAAQARKVIGIRQRLAFVQPFSRAAVDVGVDGIVPAVLVDIQRADDVAGFALFVDGAGFFCQRERFLRVFQPLVVAAGFRGDLGIGAEFGLGDEDGGELFTVTLLPGQRFRLQCLLPGVRVTAGYDVDADDGGECLHLPECGAVLSGDFQRAEGLVHCRVVALGRHVCGGLGYKCGDFCSRLCINEFAPP